MRRCRGIGKNQVDHIYRLVSWKTVKSDVYSLIQQWRVPLIDIARDQYRSETLAIPSIY